MKRCLNWWDLTWFGFGSVIGAGIFVLTGQEAHDHAGPAIVLSYVASGISAMLSVFCYNRFAVEIRCRGLVRIFESRTGGLCGVHSSGQLDSREHYRHRGGGKVLDLGVFRAAAIVYFAYGGFDNIATMAEETRNPSKDIPLGLLGSMSIITAIYCLMALALSMMQKYTDIDPNAAYSVAFKSVGMKWAQYLVALGALKGMTTVLLVEPWAS
ncbi:Cationic amino acid transporter 5 [Ananas comosus]|uniref:Cationic amino acid transporter 5 n=1 Tax=Ananas comosus TaxID=4615 RepID=A0A199VBX1_ANACO|nr:Cationic amino acid transporter 5 [Ananas comosus]